MEAEEKKEQEKTYSLTKTELFTLTDMANEQLYFMNKVFDMKDFDSLPSVMFRLGQLYNSFHDAYYRGEEVLTAVRKRGENEYTKS